MKKTEPTTLPTIKRESKDTRVVDTKPVLASMHTLNNIGIQGLASQTFARVAMGVQSSNYNNFVRIESAAELLESRPDWAEKEYRAAYLEGFVEQNIALQIKANRKLRGWTQKQLALKMNSKQSSVARFEDPTYGKHSLESLLKIAESFDCALQVRFIPFSRLVKISANVTYPSMIAKGYEDEKARRIDENATNSLR